MRGAATFYREISGIGSLAIHGTVNDLLMAGATPRYVTLGLILEEGFRIESLKKIASSIKKAADDAQVCLVAGDTKVVDKGKGDGIYINTAGVGTLDHSQIIHPRSVQIGDKILLSGDIGRHGVSLMAEREGLMFETSIQSDSACLSPFVLPLLKQGIPIHCLRDLTRGGLATALNELCISPRGMVIDEEKIFIQEEVRGACEILGLDPLYLANEGRMIAIVPRGSEELVLKHWHSLPDGSQAAVIGEVIESSSSFVLLRQGTGTERILDIPTGIDLPRIC